MTYKLKPIKNMVKSIFNHIIPPYEWIRNEGYPHNQELNSILKGYQKMFSKFNQVLEMQLCG